MKNNSIIIFSYNYPPMSGGISRLSEMLAINLSNKKSKVLTERPRKEHIIHNALTHYYVPNKRPWRELKSIYWLLFNIKKDDIIISNNWNPEGYLSILFGGKKNIILLHGAELLIGKGWFRNYIWVKLMRFTLQKANIIIANSFYTASLVKGITNKTNCIVLPLGVDENKFYPFTNNENRFKIKNKFIIGTVSRLHKFKGYITIFNALSSLPNYIRDKIIYLIGGDGPEKDLLIKECNKLGISDIVKFIGYVHEEDLPLFYNALDLFILCTEENIERRNVEGFGLVFLEAQSCGVPVIGTRSGGIPNAVIENKGGILITPSDHSELCNHIIKLINSPKILKTMGELARKRILEESSWKLYFKKFNQIIDEV